MKKQEDGLTEQINKNWGGKQQTMHSSIMTEGCLGSEFGRCLNIGEVQYMQFQEGEKPFMLPGLGLLWTAHDRFENDMTPKEIEKCNNKRRKEIAKLNLSLKFGEEPHTELNYPAIMIEGYLGKNKGWAQILYERGKWKDGMMNSKSERELNQLRLDDKELPSLELCGDLVLAACPDFANERSALAELLEKNGHIVLPGVCCHPELAGCGVEYCFGMSKRYYRRHNDLITATMDDRVAISLSEDVIKYEHICKFERRTRSYMNMYLDLAESANGDESNILCSYEHLELSMKDRKKTHRNILEIERNLLATYENERS